MHEKSLYSFLVPGYGDILEDTYKVNILTLIWKYSTVVLCIIPIVTTGKTRRHELIAYSGLYFKII